MTLVGFDTGRSHQVPLTTISCRARQRYSLFCGSSSASHLVPGVTNATSRSCQRNHIPPSRRGMKCGMCLTILTMRRYVLWPPRTLGRTRELNCSSDSARAGFGQCCHLDLGVGILAAVTNPSAGSRLGDGHRHADARPLQSSVPCSLRSHWPCPAVWRCWKRRDCTRSGVRHRTYGAGRIGTPGRVTRRPGGRGRPWCRQPAQSQQPTGTGGQRWQRRWSRRPTTWTPAIAAIDATCTSATEVR